MARSTKSSPTNGVPYDIFLERMDKATERLLSALDDLNTNNAQAHEDLKQADLRQQEAHTKLVEVVTSHIIQTTADIREIRTRQNLLTGANGIFTLAVTMLNNIGNTFPWWGGVR